MIAQNPHGEAGDDNPQCHAKVAEQPAAKRFLAQQRFFVMLEHAALSYSVLHAVMQTAKAPHFDLHDGKNKRGHISLITILRQRQQHGGRLARQAAHDKKLGRFLEQAKAKLMNNET